MAGLGCGGVSGGLSWGVGAGVNLTGRREEEEPGGGGRRTSPPPAHAGASQRPRRRKFRSLTDPSGSNSGRGWEGAGILDANALRADCRGGSVGACPRSRGTGSGGAGVGALFPAFHPASLFWLRAEAGDPSSRLADFGRAPCFSTTEIKKFSNRSIRGAQVNLLQLWDHVSHPLGAGDHAGASP